jgi:RsiW-degrading membrane proteinase PrsW (M82 family)
VIAYDYHTTGIQERLLTFFAASVWFMIVIQFGRFSWRRLATCILGLFLGIISVTATLYVLILQENVGGMNSGGNWLEETIYFVVGVGVREEVVKLAFFAPLIILLWKERDDIGALLAASCVGLGFCLQENVSYYQGGETIALTRFLTANFLHLAWTGLLGLAFFRFCRSPKRYWETFLATFIGVIYDSLLGIPEFGNYAVLGFVIIFFVAQHYFHKAAEHSDANQHVLAPLAVFLAGTSLLTGVVMNYAAWRAPFTASLLEVGFAVLSIAPVALVFVNQFKEP